MQLSNTDNLAGQRIVRHVGLVSGNRVASRMGNEAVKAALKRLEKGQDPTVLTDWLAEARAVAVNRLSQGAESLGANAVLNVRFDLALLSSTAVEVFVYGTAAVVEPAEPPEDA